MSTDHVGRAGSVWTTIRDVAARAGVSVGTASKALSNKEQVAPLTKLRVQQAAAELNFTPNALIRSLQRGQTKTIGVMAWPVIDNATHSITMSLLKGMSDGIAVTGRDLLLYSESIINGQPIAISTFMDGRVDGSVIGPDALSVENLEALAASGFPSVVVYRKAPEGSIGTEGSMGSVTIDNASGVRAAVSHLAGLGHRHIGCSIPQDAFVCVERYAAFQEAIAELGLHLDPAHCYLHSGSNFDIEATIRALFDSAEPPTALFVGNDTLALRWLAALSANGIRVPEDLSLVGFDDCPAASAAPGLTTIRQPAYEVGRMAGLFVDRLIAGSPATDCQIQLPAELIVRGTTAPPRQR